MTADSDQVRKKTANQQARLSGELGLWVPTQWGVLFASSIREDPCPVGLSWTETPVEDY